MPTHYYMSAWEREPRRAARCRKIVEAEMVAAGWIMRSKKFNEVAMRKARQLFAKGDDSHRTMPKSVSVIILNTIPCFFA